MQPSSLIFVVVIAIWAAYLLQYWVRRREHMSTARSVDRFSEAMRVLDRRTIPLVHDAPAAARTTLVARTPSGEEGSAGSDADSGMPSGPAASAGEAAGGVTGGRPRREGPTRLSRRLRGVGLLAAMALVPVSAVLAALGAVPWWTLGLALAALGLCIVTLRLAVARERTARHTERSMRASGVGVDAEAALGAPEAPTSSLEEGDPGTSEPADEAVARPAGPPAYRPGDPTWNPVPVPRPTYQLKDPAPPPRPEPKAAAERPAFDQEQPDQRTERAPRRAVGG